MDIGTIIAGLNALGGLFGGNSPIPMTPAQAEEKPKKEAVQPMNTFVILPNQTSPMGIGVPPAPPPFMPSNTMLSANAPQIPSLLDLYRLYFGTRF